MTTQKAMINPAELLAQQLATANDKVDVSESNKIKISVAAGFTAPDGTEGREMELVVVGSRMVNAYYNTQYDANNYTPPVCYASAEDRHNMAPVKGCPIPQHENCAGCPQNKYKSGVGNAKACKNMRQLAVVPATNIKNGPMWLLSVPPNASGRWDKYFTDLAHTHQLTPMFVITEVKQPKTATYASPYFEMGKKLTEAQVIDAASRMEDAADLLDYIPDFEVKK